MCAVLRKQLMSWCDVAKHEYIIFLQLYIVISLFEINYRDLPYIQMLTYNTFFNDLLVNIMTRLLLPKKLNKDLLSENLTKSVFMFIVK